MGAFEVSEQGDLANWSTDDPEFPPGVGGAMDLAVGAKEVRALLDHTTRDGEPRIRRQCRYPLTAERCVSRIYTNLAVLDVTPEGLLVREMVDGAPFGDVAWFLHTRDAQGLYARVGFGPPGERVMERPRRG